MLPCTKPQITLMRSELIDRIEGWRHGIRCSDDPARFAGLARDAHVLLVDLRGALRDCKLVKTGEREAEHGRVLDRLLRHVRKASGAAVCRYIRQAR